MPVSMEAGLTNDKTGVIRGAVTSVTDIADKFNYTEKDVLRSLMYWESRQLLALDAGAARYPHCS